MTSEWGHFVVQCMPIIRAEAERLARSGAQIDIDDAVQEVAAGLIEDEGALAHSNVRARIRSRLIDLHRRTVRQKRARREIDIDRVPGTRAFDGLSVESHEGEAIEKIDAMKLLDLWPETKGGERAARRMRDRWLPMFQEFAKRGAA